MKVCLKKWRRRQFQLSWATIFWTVNILSVVDANAAERPSRTPEERVAPPEDLPAKPDIPPFTVLPGMPEHPLANAKFGDWAKFNVTSYDLDKYAAGVEPRRWTVMFENLANDGKTVKVRRHQATAASGYEFQIYEFDLLKCPAGSLLAGLDYIQSSDKQIERIISKENESHETINFAGVSYDCVVMPYTMNSVMINGQANLPSWSQNSILKVWISRDIPAVGALKITIESETTSIYMGTSKSIMTYVLDAFGDTMNPPTADASGTGAFTSRRSESMPQPTIANEGRIAPSTIPAAPAPANRIEWYIANQGQRAGPFEKGSLRDYAQRGAINSDTLVWRQGLEQWVRAGDASDLADLFPAPPPVPPPPPAVSAPSPIPAKIDWYVADQGQRIGPLNENGLRDLAAKGVLKEDTPVWRQGLAQWIRADSAPEFNAYFKEAQSAPATETLASLKSINTAAVPFSPLDVAPQRAEAIIDIEDNDGSLYAFNNTYIDWAFYIDGHGVGKLLNSGGNFKNPTAEMNDVRSILFSSPGTYFFLTRSNELWALGNNRKGQVGDDTGIDKDSPVLVMRDVANVFKLMNHTETVFAQKIDKSAWAWGAFLGNNVYAPKNIDNDYFVINNNNAKLSPELVNSILFADHILGKEINRARQPMIDLSDEMIEALGGRDNIVASVEAKDGETSMSRGSTRIYALTKDGTAWGWGDNDGYLGDGTRAHRDRPVKIASGVKRIFAGGFVSNDDDWYRWFNLDSNAEGRFKPEIMFIDCLYAISTDWSSSRRMNSGMLWFTRDGKILTNKTQSSIDPVTGKGKLFYVKRGVENLIGGIKHSNSVIIEMNDVKPPNITRLAENAAP